MSNGEESGKNVKDGKETLTMLLEGLVRSGAQVATPTIRMRAALALAVLDNTVKRPEAVVLSGLINGKGD